MPRQATLLSIIAVLVFAPAMVRADDTPLVTGNGFGFAVYATKSGGISKLFAHPYSFTKPDPKDELGEGVETANFVAKLAWDESGLAQVNYLDESHIIVVDRKASRQTFFMPFGLERNVLIATWQAAGNAATAPALCAQWAHPLSSQQTRRIAGIDVRVLRFDGVDETLVAMPLGGDTERSGPEAGPLGSMTRGRTDARPGCLAGRMAWALISLEDVKDLDEVVTEIARWASAQTVKVLVEHELAEVDAWRVKPELTFASDQERRLWRQSEMVLRMGQSREPNRPGRYSHGMIVACLPDGSWFVPWVRDMAYAIHAFIRMGHQAEARAGIEAYFHAQSIGRMQKEVGGHDYQISVVRYFGDGSEEPFFTQERDYNVELDNWGLVLWVIGEYVQRFHDTTILVTSTYRGTIYDSAKQFIVKPLLANLVPHKGGSIVRADTSIWEERQKDQKHFAYSTTMAIVGLRHFDALAIAQQDKPLHKQLERELRQLDKGFAKAFVRDGSLHGTLEGGLKNDIDGAVLSAINFKLVNDPAVMKATVKQMAQLEVASGGYRRVTSVFDDPKIYEYWYERQEFLFINFSLAEVYLRLKEPDRAAPLLATMVDKAARDHFLIPEMYVSVDNPLFKGVIGQPTGAIPMVGYGAGVYIAHLIERQELGFAPASTKAP